LDRFTTSDLSVCGEICLDVRHALLSRAESLDSIKMVVSHPQALAQCRQWLDANLPGRPTVVAASTAAAAAEATGDPSIAAVGGAMLAEMYGLNVLAEGIQDRPVNVTRFLVIGRKKAERTGRDKTSIWFVAPHRPGALHGALECLADAGLNLTRIESRPARVGVWEYVFFADFEGHVEDEAVKSALERLSRLVDKVRVLGSYARENGVLPHPGGGA
jgi:chorismate mutase/prephenate dehydratase